MANEVYVLDVDEKSSKHGSPSRYDGRGCCAYSEGAASGSPIIGVSIWAHTATKFIAENAYISSTMQTILPTCANDKSSTRLACPARHHGAENRILAGDRR